MDPYTKDLIDAVSKIGGLITVIIGVIMAIWQIQKGRKQRELEIQKREDQAKAMREQRELEIQKHEDQANAAREQRERELKKREYEIKTQRAIFWLNLRQMFSKFDTTHRMLRNGTWPYSHNESTKESNSEKHNKIIEQLPELEAYMGLFEHCKFMIDDELIDLQTFESIYGYRMKNIIKNKLVANMKFKDPKPRKGWQDFIELANKMGIDVPE